MTTITVELTLPQALELRNAACNGYGDGDLYDAGRGSEQQLFLRAMTALEDAIEKKRGRFTFRIAPRKDGT